ncbi:MAG TPA: hypothetical protein VEU96_25395, partial [Bryobacteraceae bacterium]|nr:hypothetical protein [Bryobacteraceae bacterium]
KGIPGPAAGSLTNSATLTAAELAAGELVTIFGTGLGPTQGVGPALDPFTGLVPTTLGGVRVTFDGVAAPILYASDKQINAIVPFTIYGRATSKVTVERDGVPSDAILMSLTDSFPQVFVSGAQQIVVNSDGTLNSVTNPAKGGSYVTFYMSGLGRTNPAGIDGHLAAFPLPAPLIPLTTDDPYKILYAGSAPGIVEGFIQVNMQVPANAQGGFNRVPLHSGFSDTTVGLYIR